MKIIKNIGQLVTLERAHRKDGRKLLPEDLGVILDAAVIYDDTKIIWAGEESKIPSEYSKFDIEIDLGKRVLLPELVDCHTHLIFGGNRSSEYSMRLNGADYQEIGKAGGGILSTVTATRKDHVEFFLTAKERIERIHSYGVGTIEIKSGYGLDAITETSLSSAIKALKDKYGEEKNIRIQNTYMAAHAIPKDFKDGRTYISEVCIPMMDELYNSEEEKSCIDAVDIFHETGYFSSDDVKLLFNAAKKLGLPVKTHADEFQDNDGAALAVEFNALSTDHLLCTSDSGIKALAASSTVATLLPGTGYFLGKPQANARKFLDAGCKVAIGSDYNPGSCHCDNVLLIASLAAPNYKMNITELWSSITLNAAHALGFKDQGAIVAGLKPRFSAFDVESVDEITYNWGRNFANRDISF